MIIIDENEVKFSDAVVKTKNRGGKIHQHCNNDSCFLVKRIDIQKPVEIYVNSRNRPQFYKDISDSKSSFKNSYNELFDCVSTLTNCPLKFDYDVFKAQPTPFNCIPIDSSSSAGEESFSIIKKSNYYLMPLYENTPYCFEFDVSQSMGDEDIVRRVHQGKTDPSCYVKIGIKLEVIIDADHDGSYTTKFNNKIDMLEKHESKLGITMEKGDYSIKLAPRVSIYKITQETTEEEFKKTTITDLAQRLSKAANVLKCVYEYIIFETNDPKEDEAKLEWMMRQICALSIDGVGKLGVVEERIRESISSGSKQMVLTGAPGTGKTYSALKFVKRQLLTEYEMQYLASAQEEIRSGWQKASSIEDKWKLVKDEEQIKKKWHFVQFHPSYDYTDFVEGLKPITNDSNKTEFVRMDGSFKEFCRKAAEDYSKDSKYRYFVIDEINRADLSKVFGELMYCLEEDYRGPEHAIPTQYANLKTYGCDDQDGVFTEGFYIPDNVIIIGTMNDIDRSVDTFDFALRRRFRWLSVDVNDALLRDVFTASNTSGKDDVFINNTIEKIGEMNNHITNANRLSKDYCIGPAYFKSIFSLDWKMDDVYKQKIKPLLKEYLRGEDYRELLTECSSALDVTDDAKSDVIVDISKAIWEAIDSGSRQLVLTGAPGTGKTWSATEFVRSYYEEKEGLKKDWKQLDKEGKCRFVQFHPSYDYTDFVEGLRPATDKTKESTFVRMDGDFKKFCRMAAKADDQETLRFFVIDEINRADLSKVFGELMYCLEEDYRGKDYEIGTQYSNLTEYEMSGNVATPISDNIYSDAFYIPKNVVIIGTMNDIDRSVDTFDYALRRRFKWISIDVSKELIIKTFANMNNMSSSLNNKTIIDYSERINNMNLVLSSPDYDSVFKSSNDYYIGPAYFKGLFKGEGLESIFINRIQPLLKEYVRGQLGNDEEERFIGKCRKALLE